EFSPTFVKRGIKGALVLLWAIFAIVYSMFSSAISYKLQAISYKLLPIVIPDHVILAKARIHDTKNSP
ncbi:MAG TPA: hypothetical protein PLE74_09825, partial [Candidatus Cloacimonadota bacterium]|nr:hypothetical protein [Candidatus Cloacimonadota bacterium]